MLSAKKMKNVVVAGKLSFCLKCFPKFGQREFFYDLFKILRFKTHSIIKESKVPFHFLVEFTKLQSYHPSHIAKNCCKAELASNFVAQFFSVC